MNNPSFEDIPRKGTPFSPPIKDWKDCAVQLFQNESPPDIHPAGIWGVSMKAIEGNSYIGLVTRYTNTFETLSQQLKQPLENGKCYTLSVYLAVSKIYSSPTPRSLGNSENFTTPVELMIWGANDYCKTDQLLCSSGAVLNNDWIKYSFKLYPEKTFQYITIEAFYTKGSLEPYNGHILVDGFSPIIEIECK